jgi:hypothetical protein
VLIKDFHGRADVKLASCHTALLFYLRQFLRPPHGIHPPVDTQCSIQHASSYSSNQPSLERSDVIAKQQLRA